MKFVALLGRIFYSLIFITSALQHFTPGTIAYAANAGVPLPILLVPCAGIMAFVGGCSILFGYKARWGALLLILFLVPVTLMMHQFWESSDPAMESMQKIMFFKNLSMLGGALLISYFGSGPLSMKE
ncbi:MAG: DoxX family protein [Verrucomicrobia bacterium]|nr:DoxX family protein [Verrucomicrobiota bacterium]